MEKNRKVTIVVPTYNSSKYIHKCLDSIINQTYRNLEIIIIDDCSIDDTTKILNRYRNRDSRIKIFVNEVNKGVSYSRNIGIKNSSGYYITFADSDDWLEPNSIEILVRDIQKGNQLATASWNGISPDKKIIDNHSQNILSYKNKKSFYLEHFFDSPCPGGGCYLE